ncbi:MAG: hypothetical protein PF450_03605, partial [Bacteroidales bacterium]|nr:hypothetical protein [Bacteroidales bacterium]
MDRGKFFQSKLIAILLITLLFFIILAISIVLFLPRIIDSVHDSHVIPLIKNHQLEKRNVQKEVLLSL